MEIELLVEGFTFLEAPRIDLNNNLYFSDIAIGGIFKRTPRGNITHLLPERTWIGGLALNVDGRIIASGHGGLVIFDEKSGTDEVLLDRVDGQVVKGINDIQPDGEGGLYAGLIDPAAQTQLSGTSQAQPLVLLAANRQVRRVAEDIKVSNGIGLSPDRRTLYQVETMQGVLAYDRAADGSLSNRRLAIEQPLADGISVDSEGSVWVAVVQSSSIKRFMPDGKLDRSIVLPIKDVTSLTFGGEDLRDMYVVTASDMYVVNLGAPVTPAFKHTGNVYRIRSDVAGQATPPTLF